MIILPLKKCLNKYNYEFCFFNSVSSTMDKAKFKVDSQNKNFVILSNKQTGGRGRRGNKWISSSGNIYCTIAFSTKSTLNELYKFVILASIAVKHSLEHIGLKNIFFKWPNDVYCNNKKISGIIQESYKNKFEKGFLIVGIGINFHSSPKINNYQTTYIKKYANNIILENYFEIFINYILHYFNNFIHKKFNNFFIEFKKFQMFKNSHIKIKINENNIINGQFIGINNDGSLILKKDNQELSIYSGQIQL